jgi:hypothetical protein
MKGYFAMKNRMFSSLCFAIVAVTIVWAFCQQGQTQDKTPDQPAHTTVMQSCAMACSDCQRSCDMCAVHCATMLQDGKKEHLTSLMTCRDCATVCSAAAQIAARGGPFSKTICLACAETCSSCAKECQKFANDNRMKACADECAKCEQACRDMIDHLVTKK